MRYTSVEKSNKFAQQFYKDECNKYGIGSFFSLLSWSLLMRSPSYLYVCVSSLSTVECLNQSLWNLVCINIYHGNWAHLNWNHSDQSVCVYVCVSLLSLQCNGSVKCIPLFGARRRLGKHVPAAMNARNNRRINGRVIFYAIRVLWKESLWVCLCIPLSLLNNNYVRTFLRQRIIVGEVVFFGIRVVSKKVGDYFFPELIDVLEAMWNRCN
jgi:hypothetical protein